MPRRARGAPPPSRRPACGGAARPPVPAPAKDDEVNERESPIPITKDDPTWGSRTALVTIVEFSDFQCPFCARAVPTLEKLKAQYGPADLRIVWKHMPLGFHAHARPAAEASQAAFALGGSEAFWRFHAKAYGGGELPDAFDGWAADVGVDPASFKAAIEAHRGGPVVDDDVALAGKLNVDGTPDFFVNGVEMSGAQPFEKMAQVIDDAIVQAKAAVDHGVPRDALYLVASTYNRKNHPTAAEPEEPKADDKTICQVPVGKSPALGPATALVTVVEFSDFQCPFCQRAEATLKTLRETYGGRLRLVWKNEPLPFHPRAEPAAEAAAEARAQKGDAGFWDMHDRLFADQSHLSDDDIAARAKAMKLDVGKVMNAIKTQRHKAALDADNDLADDVGAQGTPTFFINGRKIVGAQPVDAFKAVIDEEETKAKALVAKGTAPALVYEELQKAGKEPPPPERKEVALDPHAPARGPAGAPVVIQEFADFQCPFCSRVEDTLKAIEHDFPGRVRFVWRNLPLPMHAQAPAAAEAAMEVYAEGGAAAFWKMHDKLLAGQKAEDGLSRESILRYAKEAGADAARVGKAIDGESHKAGIEADKQAAGAVGIVGTPAFVINGYFLSGAQPVGRFRRVVERALSDAKGAAGKK